MLFNSPEFALFLALAGLFYFLSPFRLRAPLLVVASYVFYMYWRWEYGFLLAAQTALSTSAVVRLSPCRRLNAANRSLKYGRFHEDRAKRWIEKRKNRPVKIDPKGYQTFLSTIDFLKTRGVTILLVDMPNVRLLNQAEWPESKEVREVFQRLKGQYTNVYYYDLSRVYQDNREMFYDTIHLNAEGQKIVKAILAGKVKSKLQVGPDGQV